ncbi:unnamed protein product [Urochloa humidicola]
MAAEESRLRFALIGRVGNAAGDVTAAEAARAIATAVDVAEDEFTIKPFHPENFLVECHTREARDRVLAGSPVPLANTALSLRPWTRLVRAESMTAYAKIKLELVGIPIHAWSLTTVRKLLEPFCWVEKLDAATEEKSDLTQFTLTAWTRDPAAIPELRKLAIAERERPVIHSEQLIFGRVTPYLREKSFLVYDVHLHLRSVADFAPHAPSTSSSSPSDDGDSGPDRNPDHLHGFRQGTAGPRFSGFTRRDRLRDGAGGGGAGEGSRGRPVRQASLAQALQKEKALPALVVESCFPKADSNRRQATRACTATRHASACGVETTGGSALLAGAAKTGKAGVTDGQLILLECQSVAFELQRERADCPTRVEDPMLLEVLNQFPSRHDTVNDGIQRLVAELQHVEVPAVTSATVPMAQTTVAPTTVHTDGQEEVVLNSPVHEGTEVGQLDQEEAPKGSCNIEDGPEITIGPEHLTGCDPANGQPASPPGTPVAHPATTDAQDQERDPASAKLSAFTKAVQRKIQTPLAQRPPKTKRAAPVPTEKELPKRSERLANHPLAQVASSKRAEVVLMRRFDVIPAETTHITKEAKQAYQKFYAAELRDKNYAAVQDLIPSLKSTCPVLGMQA